MALGDGEDHGVLHRAGVKLRRTHQIAHILQHHQVQFLRTEGLQTLLGHVGVQVAHAAGVKLNGPDAGAVDGSGVYVGVDVRLHDAHAQLVFQRLDGPAKGGGFPGAGRGHEVQKKGFFPFQLLPQGVGLPAVFREDALLHFDDLKSCHTIPPFLD